jgi:predicted kinase
MTGAPMTGAPKTRALLLVQMSGVPGSGKSTLARLVSRGAGAVILDHDVIKSALIDGGLPAGHGDPRTDPEGLGRSVAGAGQAAYEVAFALAAGLLAGQTSVVLDSPCYYDGLLRRGQRLAGRSGATYRYVECVTDDLTEVERRLRDRPPLPSQCAGLAAAGGPADDMSGEEVSGQELSGQELSGEELSGQVLSGEELFRCWIAGMRRPANGGLRVDTGRPPAICAAEVLAYLESPESPESPVTARAEFR